MDIIVKQVETEEEMDQAFFIRRKVFIEEQSVPKEIEMDEFGSVSMHVLAKIKGEPVGTARWRTTERGEKLERFAVLKSYRSLGVGKVLVNFILSAVSTKSYVYLNAQESVITFYEQFGFECEGAIFYEAGIRHRKMVLNANTIVQKQRGPHIK